MRMIFFVVTLFLAGCMTKRPVILLQPNDRSYTLPELKAMAKAGRPVHGTIWYSADEFDWIAKKYAADKHFKFDFHGVDVLIWVTQKKDHLATVEYGGRIGAPVLTVEIGYDGNVIKHTVATAIDGSAFFYKEHPE